MSLSIKVASAQYPIDFFSNFSQWQDKSERWVREAAQAGASYLLFPEYGSMELTSLLDEKKRQDLKSQAKELLQYRDEFILTFQNLAKKYQVYIIAPSLPYYQAPNLTTNRVFVFSPEGKYNFQDKLFMTRFEDEEWGVQSSEFDIKIFSTSHCEFSVVTCFDIEFAFSALAAAQAGAQIIFNPSCTETLKGMNRVHIGARARALENQAYVVVSQVVGAAKWSPAVDLNNGFAAIYATPDVGFADDGVIATGKLNEITWIYADLRLSHLEKVRNSGAVFNFKKHLQFLQRSAIKLKTSKVIL